MLHAARHAKDDVEVFEPQYGAEEQHCDRAVHDVPDTLQAVLVSEASASVASARESAIAESPDVSIATAASPSSESAYASASAASNASGATSGSDEVSATVGASAPESAGASGGAVVSVGSMVVSGAGDAVSASGLAVSADTSTGGASSDGPQPAAHAQTNNTVNAGELT